MKGKNLVKSNYIRLSKSVIKKQFLADLKEMPNDRYYEYTLEALSAEEYRKRGALRRSEERF